MFRYKMVIEYDGTFFCGWQRQGTDIVFFEKYDYGPNCCGKSSQRGAGIPQLASTPPSINAMDGHLSGDGAIYTEGNAITSSYMRNRPLSEPSESELFGASKCGHQAVLGVLSGHSIETTHPKADSEELRKKSSDQLCTLMPSVQAVIENAVKKVTGMEVLVEGAGRTDAGVHAIGQVAHFDLPELISAQSLLPGFNFYCRRFGAVILDIELVDSDFHSRFSAISREYIYRIVNRAAPLTVLSRYAWHVATRLDIDAMAIAAARLLGTHDFSAFRSSSCQSKRPVKTLDAFEVRLPNLAAMHGNTIEFYVKARSFLHNQVRIMVGTLVLIGKGKMVADEISELICSGDRTKAGITAPPHGLYLTKVNYDS
jgi:tRNA pseudouridine38-40 synthase